LGGDDQSRQDHQLRAENDGSYLIEFKTANGDSLAISIPRTEADVIKHFQARMPYGLVVPDVDATG
jgi:hypothetical protein